MVLALVRLPASAPSGLGTGSPMASAIDGSIGSLPMNSFLSKEMTAYGAEPDAELTARLRASMTLTVRWPRGAAVLRVGEALDDEDEASRRCFAGGSFIVKSGAADRRRRGQHEGKRVIQAWLARELTLCRDRRRGNGRLRRYVPTGRQEARRRHIACGCPWYAQGEHAVAARTLAVCLGGSC